MSIFKDGHNLQIKRKDKYKGKDKDHAIASDLEVVFNGNFQKLVPLSKITSLFSNPDDISNEAFLSIKYIFVVPKNDNVN